MNIQFTARHFKGSESLQQRIQEEVDRLEKFYDRITACHVTLDAESKSRVSAEIKIAVRDRHLVAKAHSDVMIKAFEAAIDKIERQLKKSNEKKREHRKIEKPAQPALESEEEL